MCSRADADKPTNARSEERTAKLFHVVKNTTGTVLQNLKAGTLQQQSENTRNKQSAYTKKMLQNMVERTKNTIPHRRHIDFSPKIQSRSNSLNSV